jgi:hypothetical protein
MMKEYIYMNILKTLKQAFRLTWRYRALWLFGAILALTTLSVVWPWWDQQKTDEQIKIKFTRDFTIRLPGGGFTIDFSSPGKIDLLLDSGQSPSELRDLEAFLTEVIPPNIRLILIETAIILVVLLVLGTAARYVAETAMIRMVDDIEDSGRMLSLRGGFGLGWSLRAGRLFLVDLSVCLLGALIFTLIFGIALLPLLLIIMRSTPAILIGAAGTIGLLVVAGYLLFLGGVLLSLVMQPVKRACVLDNLGMIASIRKGFQVVRSHLKEVLSVWLTWIVVRIMWIPVSFVAMILISPVLIISLLLGGVVGGAAGLLVGGLASLFAEGAAPWVMGALIGLPILLLVAISPMLFLGGLVQVFLSNLWTLTYRNLQSKEAPARRPLSATQAVFPGMVNGVAD